MTTVYTKNEFKNALNAGVKHIVCKGAIADALIKSRKTKRKVAGGLLLTVACIAAAPFTLGASLGAGAITGAGIIASGLTIGSWSMTTVELALICGTIVSIAGHKLHCNYNKDGSVDVDVN